MPIGLQFGETAGEIINQSVATDISSAPVGLQVRLGKTLALVGSNVFVEGGLLIAPEGRIELGSVAGNSQVSIKPIEKGWSLGYEGVQNFQDIQLTKRTIDGTDISSSVTNLSGVDNSSGTIHLRGRQITITGNSSVEAYNLGVQPGESIMINASESVEVSDSSALLTATFGAGKAGDITIETPRLIVRDGGAIRAFAINSGQAGNITVDASKSVEVIRSPSSLTPGVIEAQTFGMAENAGNAGTVIITTGELSINGGGQIATSTFGAGDGGTLSVHASESVEVTGGSEDGDSSGLLAQSIGGEATGNAGMLKIDTRQLIVGNGARISVGAVNGSVGQGGELRITASDFVDVTGTGTDENGKAIPSTLIAESQGPGAAGNLTIETDRLTVQSGAEVTVSSAGTGAGDLEVTAASIRLNDKGKLTATSASGNGGDIRLQDLDLLLLRGNSEISTSAGSNGTGGDITINTDILTALEDSNITSNAFRGSGGNIKITVQGLFLSPDSNITASSDLGVDGEVEINRLEIDPSSGLVTLPTELVDVSELIAQGCSVGGGNVARGASRFVATGRGGLPPTPTEALRSDAVLADLGTPGQGDRDRADPASTNPTNSQPTPLVEAQGWVIGPQGEVVLIAQAPTVTPHTTWLKPTTCNGS